ncbi:MAG: hypothetical protein ACTS2F_25240 [Thainema sp.]
MTTNNNKPAKTADQQASLARSVDTSSAGKMARSQTASKPYRPPAVQTENPNVNVDVEQFEPAQLVQGGTELVDAAFDAAEHGMEKRFKERGQQLVKRTNYMMATLFNGMAVKAGSIRSAYITAPDEGEADE